MLPAPLPVRPPATHAAKAYGVRSLAKDSAFLAVYNQLVTILPGVSCRLSGWHDPVT